MKIPSSLTFLLLFPLLANAYTWQFTSHPRQCQNLSLSVQGSGQPPYSLLLLPTGPNPFQNTTEFRQIHNISFSGTNLSFKLDYPENSSFVGVVCSSLSCRICHFLISCTLFAGQRQQRFWYRWYQRSNHYSLIVRLELL